MATDSSFAAENSSCHRASEGQDIEVAAAGSRKLPSSKFKGVVAQPNGRWGAQIYENHQRVWLGTFTEEEEAAKAYDIAALRFRGQNAFTNFRSSMDHHANNEDNGFEKFFLLSHSKEEIVDMIRKHTYRDELERSKYNYACYNDTTNRNISGNGFPGLPGFDPSYHGAFEHLFQKIVTPSDVGRLNRIVIPKQHADKHFPTETRIAAKGVLLNFEDKMGKVWRFRYCYWKSSQSYVLTKGWTKFVKEKSLKAGDVVSFWRSMGQNPKFFIDHKAGSEPNFDQEVQNRAVHCRANMGTVRLFGVNI